MIPSLLATSPAFDFGSANAIIALINVVLADCLEVIAWTQNEAVNLDKIRGAS
ncbi:MAG: hypothetical protein Q8Q54_06895 [Methylococcales bacterium]|nr:hypothetical protein [Methylococcales bacterium]MDP3838630.1 hypothetical protein [Methylococcales bacterium]